MFDRIDEYRWRIPKSHKSGMRVDGVIYAGEAMMRDIANDKAAEQVANVAFLPGIVRQSLAMPDIHWGYGFPIGGVAATDIEAGGVVSPGGVGFDINCLSNSLILNELGYRRYIKDYEEDFQKHRLVCMNLVDGLQESSSVLRFLKQKSRKRVLSIITETGRQIEATEDHPFYTKSGMREAGFLSRGVEIAAYPFEGVEYTTPSPEVIVDEARIKELFLKSKKSSGGSAFSQIMRALSAKRLLPLKFDSWQLPYLIKIIGYCIGDGTLYFDGKRKHGTVCFYGKEKDLIRIREDLTHIGFKGSIYFRSRHHKIQTAYSLVEFDADEFSLKVSSNCFALLMAALGVPIGNKCRQAFDLPEWLSKAVLWQKRLFLAGFFGAEMSSPKTLTNNHHNFYCPTISLNKTIECMESGRRFLDGIAWMLREFSVKTYAITERKEFVNKAGIVSYRLRLMVHASTENLLRLYGTVGFDYNEDRQFLANAAIGYLRLKKNAIEEKKEVAVLAPALAASGNWHRAQIFDYLCSPQITRKFIERSLYETRKTSPRVGESCPTFDEFLKMATDGLGHSGAIWERVRDTTEIDFDDWVYDFTVHHRDHNFVANGFVVSNCGVRLVRTALREDEAQPKLRDLVYALYNDIPAGVGSKGDIKVSPKDERKLLVDGSSWAVTHGYGIQDDLEYTEDHGAIRGANPDAVSDRAYERGKSQSGTLGSGNHFIEIQVVDEIYDEVTAGVFGVELGQVVLMIHSGSRGLGYQICDEYSKNMIRCLTKYDINVPDRQLACAPVNSDEGRAYIGAMKCAANYAWANRQCLMHLVRKSFEKVFNKGAKELGMSLVYDVAHNIAKIEKYVIDGTEKSLCVHRKGATRAFPPGHPELPVKYRKTGQPVIIPGDMGRNSYLLAGTAGAEETFYSTCHGAGRRLSRTAAMSACRGRSIAAELEKKGILVMASGRQTLAEEAPEAYKDVNQVVDVVHGAGISKKVCRMRPLGVIKG